MTHFTEQAVVLFWLDILTAYELTPYEIGIIGKQTQEKRYVEYENLIATAWHTEAFARQKKLPRLSKLMKDIRRKPKKQNRKSDAILKAMAAEKGIIL